MAMVSFEQLRVYLRARYGLVVDRADVVGMVWQFTDGDTPVYQHLKIFAVQAFGAPWLVFRAEVCPADLVSAQQAMAHNCTLAVGALAFDGDVCIVRRACPLHTMTGADLEQTVEFVAHEAARMRKQLGCAAANERAFTPYEE
jgi:hypothetical protein